MEVKVLNNDVAKAMRALKKKLQNEGVLREMRDRRYYVKPSEQRVADHAAAVRRAKRDDAKRRARDA